MDLTSLMNNDRLLSPPVTPKSSPLDTPKQPPPAFFYLSPVSPPTTCHDAYREKTFKFHLERHKALPTTTTVAVMQQQQQDDAKPNKHEPMPPPKRQKQPPLRSLGSDADHAFSLLFNADQVRQYGMQAILQQKDDDNNNNSLMTGYNNKETTTTGDDHRSHMTSKRPFTTMADRHMKKAKTEAAAAYDRVDVTTNDDQIYDAAWVPLYDVFDRKPNVRPTYKGKANSPLQIDHMDYYDLLHPCEANIASQLRLQPRQYLMCKRSLILGAQDAYKQGLPFRKSDAQKLCRIDVNKVSHLWALFARLGWLEPHH